MTSVMPKPPAAFSPLTTTRSSFQSAINFGNRAVTAARPERPTTSPMKRIRMQSLPAEIDRLVLGEHEIEPCIACRGGHLGNFLNGERNPDRGHGLLRAQRRNRHVVITCAIADTMTGSVESRKRHDKD